MASNNSRSLFWGKARRPKISTKVGNPHSGEGSDGDIQVRQTSFGFGFPILCEVLGLEPLFQNNDLDLSLVAIT